MQLRLEDLWKRMLGKPLVFLRLLRHYWKRVAAVLIVIFHILGAVASVDAVMESRTSQGAVAWAISLNTFPYIAVPAYWLFGHSEFSGYVLARQTSSRGTRAVVEKISASLDQGGLRSDSSRPLVKALNRLGGLPFTKGNTAELLIDGEATFESIFAAIDQAEHYILVQFYILRDDELGRRLKDRLVAKARQGVKVRLLCDAVGSINLPDAYLSEMRKAGINAQKFVSTQDTLGRLQVNFRNHRKIVVVDGTTGFTGGLNAGDEYLGKSQDPGMSPWRDTFIKVQGPAACLLQVPFAEDWFWNTKELLTGLNWEPEAASGGNMEAQCLPTGPADALDTCLLFFLTAIEHAEQRIWIASPYFVPDSAIIAALQTAALRGVDVRLLIPKNPDSKLVYYSSFTYLPEVEMAGIKVFRYQPGFLHTKAILVDDDFTSIGTANFDNRSFRLNFELMLSVIDEEFNRETAAMFERDFARSKPASAKDLTEASFFFRLTARVCRLLAPIQ